MQTKEFDKLIIGELKETKTNLARLLQRPAPMIADLRGMNQSEVKSLSDLDPEKAREIIRQHEKPMSSTMQIKIKQYVDRRRKAGASENAIRKAVMKKFGITVI